MNQLLRSNKENQFPNLHSENTGENQNVENSLAGTMSTGVSGMGSMREAETGQFKMTDLNSVPFSENEDKDEVEESDGNEKMAGTMPMKVHPGDGGKVDKNRERKTSKRIKDGNYMVIMDTNNYDRFPMPGHKNAILLKLKKRHAKKKKHWEYYAKYLEETYGVPPITSYQDFISRGTFTEGYFEISEDLGPNGRSVSGGDVVVKVEEVKKEEVKTDEKKDEVKTDEKKDEVKTEEKKDEVKTDEKKDEVKEITGPKKATGKPLWALSKTVKITEQWDEKKVNVIYGRDKTWSNLFGDSVDGERFIEPQLDYTITIDRYTETDKVTIWADGVLIWQDKEFVAGVTDHVKVPPGTTVLKVLGIQSSPGSRMFITASTPDQIRTISYRTRQEVTYTDGSKSLFEKTVPGTENTQTIKEKKNGIRDMWWTPITERKVVPN